MQVAFRVRCVTSRKLHHSTIAIAPVLLVPIIASRYTRRVLD